MRQVVLDTETTGLDARAGDRIIEIGCVEMLDRKLTGHRYHAYINPERTIDAGALAVHGISNDFLADKPKFAQVAREFSDFVRGAELVIHNAAFDVGFLDAELGREKLPLVKELSAGVVDSLKLARELHPGRKNSLDVLCDRYEIDNSHRTLHGALLDAELLAEVYLAMTRGQESLLMDEEPLPPAACDESGELVRPNLVVQCADAEELAAHESLLADIGKASKGNCLWLKEALPA
ncbi:MAG: DNA polymerase III subunit epsilon [Rhodocyclaceae bacterium]|nr:DNA polymerase III subunit epsilon [Rhodocyclaceae bacterium]